jgi:cytochrome c553
MEQWETGLGMSCSACHAEDKERVDQDGKPILNFASDSKPEKAAARLMYTMTEEINEKYIAKIDASGMPVTCGTCHRGRLGPEPFAGAPNPGPGAPMAPAPSDEGPPNQ